MKKLSQDWITEGVLDFEYKKYILLAYLQQVSRNFNESRIYPFLGDLIAHYKNLREMQEEKERVQQHFPKRISKVDLDNFKLEYEQIMHDDRFLIEVEKILDFAIPKIKGSLKEGKDLYEYVEQNLEISPVGLLPLNHDWGYIFIKTEHEKVTEVYNYEITIFEHAAEKYRGIKTNYVSSYEKSVTNTYESIKIELLRKVKSIPNPATFLVRSRLKFPLKETLLPVAKRSFVRYLASL